MRPLMRLVPIAICVLLAACASPRWPSDAGTADADVVVDAGVIYTASPCPADPPVQNAACAIPLGASNRPFACEYGGDEWGNCTTLATCQYASWTVFTPSASCGVQPASCPAAFGLPDAGATCSDVVTCDYGEQGKCGCLSCGVWSCQSYTTAAPGCPLPRPKLGSTCPTEGVLCDYDDCCTGPALAPAMICSEGLWLPSGGDGACLCATGC